MKQLEKKIINNLNETLKKRASNVNDKTIYARYELDFYIFNPLFEDMINNITNYYKNQGFSEVASYSKNSSYTTITVTL